MTTTPVPKLQTSSRAYASRRGLNPGDPARALPYGASCAASCQHEAACRASHGILGHEGVCVHTPSRYLPNARLVVPLDDEMPAEVAGEDDGLEDDAA